MQAASAAKAAPPARGRSAPRSPSPSRSARCKSYSGRPSPAPVGRQRIYVHSATRLERGNLIDALVRFYRLATKLDSADPDIVNAVVIRMATTLEQIGRYLWKCYLDGHPNDETIEIVISAHGFDSLRHMSASELVASSRNISNLGDLRSILDKCGLGSILGGRAAADVAAVMGQRNRVVHGAGDADMDIRRMHESIEELIRSALSSDGQALLMMYVAKASVSEALEGGP